MNVKELREKLFLSQQELWDKTGIPKDRIAKWEQGKWRPKSEDTAILQRLEEEIPQSYITTRRTIKNLQENSLMFYEIGASAGTPQTGDIIPVKKSEGVLHISDLFKNSEYAIRISGNSMTPNYPSGAIIGIREIEDKIITPGSVYVIEKENDLWIKRLYYKDDNQDSGLFECFSDNTMKFEHGPRIDKLRYPPFCIEIDKVRKLFKVTGIKEAIVYQAYFRRNHTL